MRAPVVKAPRLHSPLGKRSFLSTEREISNCLKSTIRHRRVAFSAFLFIVLLSFRRAAFYIRFARCFADAQIAFTEIDEWLIVDENRGDYLQCLTIYIDSVPLNVNNITKVNYLANTIQEIKEKRMIHIK